MKKPAASKPKRRTLAKAEAAMSFTKLVAAIQHVHTESAAVVNRVVNTTLTMRNWLIGAYIHHYELNGQDRAKYGEGLIDRLAEALNRKGVTACEVPRLYSYIAFVRAYPQIGTALRTSLPQGSFSLDPVASPIFRSVTGESETGTAPPIFRSLTEQSSQAKIRQTPSAKFATDGRMLIERLSFTHLEQLLALDDPLKRAFYEIECIRGNWSVRDLKRQIGSLYFERSGLSKDKEKLSKMVNAGVETAEPKLAIRDPYIFEFLGLRAKDAVAESDLEAALIEHLREFLLELGHGFCLEAQQKSIVIGRTRGFVDLVFYHRILKCHVLVELKLEAFAHEHLGQINTYVTWYKKHMMSPGDNPPVGLLLCTGKDHALVEYATASVDNQLFVSKYAVELPTKAELQRFLDRHRKELEAATRANQP